MLGDALAGDAAIVTRHQMSLQNLDIAVQTLTALVAALGDDGAADAVNSLRLEELRISCAQALQAR